MQLDHYPDEVGDLYEGLIQPKNIDMDATLATARRLVGQGRAQGDSSLTALGLLWQALIAYIGNSDEEALDSLLADCVAAAQEAGEGYLLGRAYNVLALEALARGQSLLTYNYLSLVLDCTQHLEGRESMHLESLACGNLGAVYLYLGDFRKSLDYDMRALTLREAMSQEHDKVILASYATDVGLSAVGAGELGMARQAFDSMNELMQAQDAEDHFEPDDLYFAYELGMYLYDRLGDRARRDEEIESLIACAARLTDVVSDFTSVCRDIRFLVDEGLLDPARRLIEAARAFMESSRRPYVRVLFLRSELRYVMAVGDEARATRLSIMLYEENEQVRSYERLQLLDAFSMLDSVRRMQDENVRLSYQNRHDELTRLLNRKALREDFPQMYGHDVWAIMIDIDYFKRFNDAMGHGTGDAVLRGVAGVIRASFAQGHCYRLGGDEFLVLMEDADGGTVRQAIDGCQQAVPEVGGAALAGAPEGAGLTVGISVGYARGVPADGAGLRKVMRAADDRLFEAKRAGRSCVRGSDEAINI